MKEWKNNLGSIKEAIKHNEESTSRINNDQIERNKWKYHDSPAYSFGGTFYKSLPQEYTEFMDKKIYVAIEEMGPPFIKYIKDTLLKDGRKEFNAIEFGGPASDLFNEFPEGFFRNTLGVCLKDVRDSSEKNNDIDNNHHVIEGDILHPTDSQLYKKISDLLPGGKADLIISRMMGPLDSLEKNPAILNGIIKKWYSLLNDNGILFAQFEYFPEHNPNMEQKYEAMVSPEELRYSEIHVVHWVNEIKKKYPALLDVQLGRGVLRLHKNKGAPEELPNMENMFT
jgi:hypothetical protein